MPQLIAQFFNSFFMSKTLKNCKCGASRVRITGGGEYFQPLKRPVVICAAQACPFPRRKVKQVLK